MKVVEWEDGSEALGKIGGGRLDLPSKLVGPPERLIALALRQVRLPQGLPYRGKVDPQPFAHRQTALDLYGKSGALRSLPRCIRGGSHRKKQKRKQQITLHGQSPPIERIIPLQLEEATDVSQRSQRAKACAQ